MSTWRRSSCLIAAALLLLSSAPRAAKSDETKISLRVEKIKPEPGTVLGRSSYLRATVSYEIDLDPLPRKEFSIGFFFEGTTPDTTFQPRSSARFKYLKRPSGEVSLSYPMRRVVDSPRLARPVKVYVYLNWWTSQKTSRVVTKIGPYSYELEE